MPPNSRYTSPWEYRNDYMQVMMVQGTGAIRHPPIIHSVVRQVVYNIQQVVRTLGRGFGLAFTNSCEKMSRQAIQNALLQDPDFPLFARKQFPFLTLPTLHDINRDGITDAILLSDTYDGGIDVVLGLAGSPALGTYFITPRYPVCTVCAPGMGLSTSE